MAAHWKLAVRYATWAAVGAVLAAVAVGFYYGAGYAGALLYGAGIGILSLLSTALSVSWITGRSELFKALGAGSFFLRYGFVAGALGIPAFFGFWPAVAMLAGFAGVYLAENLVLLPGVVGETNRLTKPDTGVSGTDDLEDEELERRMKV